MLDDMAGRLGLPQLDTPATQPEGDPKINARLAEAAGLRRLREQQIENSIFPQFVVRDILFIARTTDESGSFMATFNSHGRERALQEYAAKLAHSPYALLYAVDGAYQRLNATAKTPEVRQQWATWRNESLQRLAPVFFDQDEWNTAVHHYAGIHAVTSIVANHRRVSA